MPSSSGTLNLQDACALAQKLYGECRDSPSSYKLLTTSVRKLRNSLEEVEDIFDETRTLGPDDLTLLNKVVKCDEILHQLDIALQSYQSSRHHDINHNTVADFKTILDITEHELSLTFDAITTGEIELRLDTNLVPDASRVSNSSMGVQSASTNTVDSAHDRKSSRTSSAWSAIPRDSPSQESISDLSSAHSKGNTNQLTSDDKEVYDFGGPYLHVTPSSNSAVEGRPFLDWRAPFASPDPLSKSIEQASSMILAPDDDVVSNTVRSRSGTGTTVFVELRPVERMSDYEGTAPASSTAPNQATVGVDIRNEEQAEEVNELAFTSSSPKSLDTTIASRSINSSFLGQGDTGISDELPPPVPLHQRSEDVTPPNHESEPQDFEQRREDKPISSITGSGAASKDKTERNQVAQHEQETVSEEREVPDSSSKNVEQHQIGVSEGCAQKDNTLVVDLDVVTSTVVQSMERRIPIKPLRAPSAADSQYFNQGEDELDPAKTPSMPTRRPPPPPPKPRGIKTRRRASTYRIVNATVQDSASSEDELYSTSKPTSPPATSCPTSLEGVKEKMQRVQIDNSACEEDTNISSAVNSLGQDATSNAIAQPPEPGLGISSRDDVLPCPRDITQISAGQETAKTNADPTFAPHDNNGNGYQHRSNEPTSPPLPSRPSALTSSSSHSPKQDSMSRTSPPPIPRRPIRYRRPSENLAEVVRPSPAIIQASPAAIPQDGLTMMEEKELIVDTGPEVRTHLEPPVKMQNLRQRISVDAALDVRSPSTTIQSAESMRDIARHARAASTSQVDTARPMDSDPTLTGFYAPGVDSTHPSELELERINHIVHFWNDCAWDQAEEYLMAYLEGLVEDCALARARRVRHLIGVCLSFKGEWSRAIPFFLSAMRTPIQDISEIDDGDCAAAYWLGDTYSLLNKRTEALLAYCIAERSSLFHHPTQPSLSECICAEQEAVQLGMSKDDFKVHLAQEAFSNNSSNEESILDTNVITTSASKLLVENEPRKSRRTNASTSSDPSHGLNQNRARSNAFFCLDKVPRIGKFYRMKIYADHFWPDSIWPMMYDPLFAMANVQRGRLLAYECDLLAVFASNKEARIPKSSAMGLSRMDCFTCTDLPWLIKTIRECLRTLEMEFSEVANIKGTWFVSRYSFLQSKVATTYYFSIALFKQTLRGGYGVDICPDGICSARIIRYEYGHDKGVHPDETKRIKKLIREYLDEAAKQGPNAKRKRSTSGNALFGAVPPGYERLPPPIPPRPPQYG